MNVDDLSKSIAVATNFLFTIHSDIQALVTSLDTFMEKNGWSAAWRTAHLTTGLNGQLGKEWVIRSLYRYYVPSDSDIENTERLIVIACHLSPPKTAVHDYAATVAAACRFANPVSLTEIDQRWETTTPMYRATLEKPGPTSLTRDQFKDTFPAASSVVATALPLGALNNMEAVEKFVAPILATAFKDLHENLNAALGTTWQESEVPDLPQSPGWKAAKDVLEAWATKSKTTLEQWSEKARNLLERWWEEKKRRQG